MGSPKERDRCTTVPLMNAASRHFRYFSEAEHHGIFCFAPSKRRHDMSSEIGPYLFGTIHRDFLAYASQPQGSG
jgi:hypothetical protein